MRPPARRPHIITIRVLITEDDRRTTLLTVLEVLGHLIRGIDELHIPSNAELGATVLDFDVGE